jgi:meckelin
MFIFTNAKYGYYIHGKSPNGNADASMKEMIFGIEKESYGLVGKRGLLPEEDNQVFTISITNKLRKQYTSLMLPIYQVIYFA